MNIVLSPQTIPMSWPDYLAKNYDRAMIPWERYRYSGSGVVEVVGESIQNVEIADALRDRIKAAINRLGLNWRSYQNSIGVEVERSEKQERIPDILVINQETRERIARDARIVTRDMPDPILVIEIVSPSSFKEDLEDKPFEMMDRGVGEYVAIDWRNEIVQVWSCTEDGKNYNFSEYRSGERVGLKSFSSLMMTVDEMILNA